MKFMKYTLVIGNAHDLKVKVTDFESLQIKYYFKVFKRTHILQTV